MKKKLKNCGKIFYLRLNLAKRKLRKENFLKILFLNSLRFKNLQNYIFLRRNRNKFAISEDFRHILTQSNFDENLDKNLDKKSTKMDPPSQHGEKSC